MKKYLLISGLILLLAGCKKANQQPSLSFSDLPFKQGNTWTYSRYDATPNIRDTVTLSISSIYQSSDTVFYVWQQMSSVRIDTAVTAYYRDTFAELYGAGALPLAFVLPFPLIAHSSWFDSSYTCSLSNQIQVNSKNYNGVFDIHWGSLEWPDFQLTRNIFLSKGIGIIRYNQNYSAATESGFGNLGTTNYQWDLLSYHLN